MAKMKKGSSANYGSARRRDDEGNFLGGSRETAGLPQDIIIKKWPEYAYDNSQEYDYGIKAQDKQISSDVGTLKKHRSMDRY